MSTTAASVVIHRTDYTPPAFLIDSVALEFDLAPEKTTVTNRMRVRRNPAAQHATNLTLVGDEIELVSVALDGAAYTRIQSSPDQLEVLSVPDSFELTVVSVCRPASNTSLSG